MSGWLDRRRGAFTCGDWIGVLAFLPVMVLAIVLARREPERLPQMARGDGVLAVVFGDARTAISRAMVEKADSYFHGGIDIDCHDCGHAEESCEDHGHGHGAHGHDEGRFDPWRWINARVRAPHEHLHLEGAKSVELVPWLWASVKADPHNIDAWTTAWYTADGMMKDHALAGRIIGAAAEANPKSVTVAFYRARHLYDRGRGDASAAEAAFAAVRRLAAGTEKPTSGDLSAWVAALDYLANFAEARRDRSALEELLAEAERIGADTPVPETIRHRLRNL